MCAVVVNEETLMAHEMVIAVPVELTYGRWTNGLPKSAEAPISSMSRFRASSSGPTPGCKFPATAFIDGTPTAIQIMAQLLQSIFLRQSACTDAGPLGFEDEPLLQFQRFILFDVRRVLLQ